MTDTRERLRPLHELEAPDVWADARTRTPRTERDNERLTGSRRAAVIIMALVVGVAATAVVVLAFDSGDTPVAYGPPHTWPTSEVQALGITVSYPPGWKLQPFEEEMKVHFEGILISNTDETFQHPVVADGGTTTAWAMADLPLDGVALSIEHISGGPPPTEEPSPPDSDFPLSFSDAESLAVDHASTFTPDPGPATESVVSFILDGQRDEVRVWVGPDASSQDRQALAAVVASIKPSEGVASGSPLMVPDVIAMTDQEAMRTLDDLGLTWVVAYREIEGTTSWHVAATDPVAGTGLSTGATVRLLVATDVTPIPADVLPDLDCPKADRRPFGGPKLVLLPGGSSFITANIGGIERGDRVTQVTFADQQWHGLWHVIRDRAVIALIDYDTLDGVACAGSGVAAS